MFKNGELEYDEDDDQETNRQPKVVRPTQFKQAFALPGLPTAGFKLKQTGRSLMDNSPNDGESSPQQGSKNMAKKSELLKQTNKMH